MSTKKVLCILFVVLIVAVVAAVCMLREKEDVPLSAATVSISISGVGHTVLLAESISEKRKGLGGVTDLSPYAGMLFVLEDSTSGGIWMDGMLIPLDILWLAEDGTVLKMEENIAASDKRVFPHHPAAHYVLEVSAGFAAQQGIAIGSVVGL